MAGIRNNPKFFAIATVILWSAFAPLAKAVSKSEYLHISFSFFFTLVTFSIVLSIGSGPSPWRRIRNMKPAYWIYGSFGYFFYWMGLIQSFRQFSSASGTTVLNYTWPIFTVLFTELIFRRTRKSRIYRLVESLGIGLGFAAVVVLATRGDVLSFEITHIKGLLWGLFAGSTYGFFSAYSGTVRREDHGLFLMISALASFILMVPFALTEIELLRAFTYKDFILVAVLGSAVDGGGYFLWTSANLVAREQDVDISAVSSLVFFLPLISVVIVSVVLGEGEIFKAYFAVTLVLLIAGSILCQKTQGAADRLRRAFTAGQEG